MDKKTREQQIIARAALLGNARAAVMFAKVNPAAAVLAESTIEYLEAEIACEDEDAAPAARRKGLLKVLDYVAASYLRAHPHESPSNMRFFDVARWLTNLPTTLLSKALQIPDVPETPEINPHGGVG